jgi:hypothetical protein
MTESAERSLRQDANRYQDTGLCPIGGGPGGGTVLTETSRTLPSPIAIVMGNRSPRIKQCVALPLILSSHSLRPLFSSPSFFFRVELTFDLHLPSILRSQGQSALARVIRTDADNPCRSPSSTEPVTREPSERKTLFIRLFDTHPF